MESSDNLFDEIKDSAGGHAHQSPRSVPDEAELSGANHTNPVQVMPCQIQSIVKCDGQGRRYMVLENLPLDKNYVANWINNGGEFAIGGTPAFISEALSNELKARAVQDSREHHTQSWHVVALPDSNMSNETISYLYRGAEATERYPIATQLRPAQQSHQGNQQTSGLEQHSQAVQTTIGPQERRLSDQQPTFIQQNPYSSQQAGSSHQSFLDDQQPILTYNNGIVGYGREHSSVPQLQQSRLATPMPGDLSGGSGPMVMFPQEQPYFHTPQQGSLQGFGLNNGPAQESYLVQGNNMMFDPIGGFSMGPLPQTHRPIFDRFGSIVGQQANANDGGMYGDNLYDGEMYRTRMYKDFGHPQPSPFQVSQQVQGTNMKREPQLEDAAQSFYTFVANKLDDNEIDQGEHDQLEDFQEDGAQEKGSQEEGPQEEGPHEEGPQEEGPHEEGPQEEGPQDEGAQQEGAEEEDDPDEDTEEDDLEDGDQGGANRIDDNQDHIGAEEQEAQDEGIAMGNTSREDASSPNSAQELPNQRPELPPSEILWARERSPYRFQDRTGMGYCDYCDRDDHEAYACLKWDPDHYDKPVCTACNNKEHTLDECPKFRAMSFVEKQTLLVEKGAGRPGVRSQYHAWTRYVVRGVAGLPLTRRFLQDLSNSSGSDLADTWKEWDYNQGIPDQFRDSVAEVLAADDPVSVDERFMDGNHGFERKVQPGDNL